MGNIYQHNVVKISHYIHLGRTPLGEVHLASNVSHNMIIKMICFVVESFDTPLK